MSPRGKHPPACIPCTGQSSCCFPIEDGGEWGPDAKASKRGAARPAGNLVLELGLPSLHGELATAISNCNLTQPAIKHSWMGESSL